MNNPIRILIIEDNLILREGLETVLAKKTDHVVVASVGEVDDLGADFDFESMDLVLLDIGLRSQSSLDTANRFKRDNPRVKVMVMGLFPTHSDILEFVQASVDGFLLKDVTVDEFFNSIRSVMNGDKILPAFLTDSLFAQIVEQSVAEHQDPKKVAGALRMTQREKEVIALIAEGQTNKEIGKSLSISDFTVKSHVHNILEKLALHSRLQIAMYSRNKKMD